jgi:hypothetical protein
MSAAFSPIMIDGALVLPDVSVCDPAWKIDPCRGVIGVQL